METWCKFVDSLGTRGSAILLLVLTSIGLFVGMLHILHHGDKGDVSATVVATFSGFCGALLTVLSTQGKAQNGNGTKPADTSAPLPPDTNGGR